MKNKNVGKKQEARRSAEPSRGNEGSKAMLWAALGAAALAAWWAWGAAFHGPFLFDDTVMQFALPQARDSFQAWVGWVRPVTMFSYWISAQLSGDDPFAYHVMSVLFHLVVSGLVFVIVRRLLEWAAAPENRRDLLAGFAAAVFLLHPAQAESVAYLAGRAEVVSVMFAFAAFAVFLYRSEKAISWGRSMAVLALFGLSVLSKEHTIVLPALLLLTDYWWNPGFRLDGAKRNWKLYAPLALGAVAAVARFWGQIMHAPSAGFGMKDLAWYQYLFTQFRAVFVYLEIFVAPVRLTADWDFPISKTILDHGAIVGLIVLLALMAAAWTWRRRFPLATYGFFVFLLLLSPTSSILPIKDPVAERRIYFAMIGLLLIVADVLSRVKVVRRALATGCAALALVAAVAAHARAEVWSDPILLWQDTVAKSPRKMRAHFQLAQAYYDAGRYPEAVVEFEKTAGLEQPDYNLLVDWGLALDQLARRDEAIAKLKQAAALEPTAHIYSQIGMVYAEQKRWPEALGALATGEKLDPNYAMIYNYRAKVYFQQNQLCPAVQEYRRALSLNPRLADAQAELARAEAMARAAGGC